MYNYAYLPVIYLHIISDYISKMPDHEDEACLIPETSPALSREGPKQADIAVYTRRWYVLSVFCLMTCIQALTWNTWAPISQAAEAAFGWTDSTVALLTNWGPIMYTLSTLLMAWLMDVKGIKSNI